MPMLIDVSHPGGMYFSDMTMKKVCRDLLGLKCLAVRQSLDGINFTLCDMKINEKIHGNT